MVHLRSSRIGGKSAVSAAVLLEKSRNVPVAKALKVNSVQSSKLSQPVPVVPRIRSLIVRRCVLAVQHLTKKGKVVVNDHDRNINVAAPLIRKAQGRR